MTPTTADAGVWIATMWGTALPVVPIPASGGRLGEGPPCAIHIWRVPVVESRCCSPWCCRKWIMLYAGVWRECAAEALPASRGPVAVGVWGREADALCGN